jgi:hypothetical protein
MSFNNIIKFSVPVSLAVALAWPVAALSEYVESGFLEDYSILKTDLERPQVSLYIADGANLDDYDKILVEDISIFMHPESEYTGISPRKLSAVTDEFESHLLKNLEKKREIVSEITPDDKVVVLRMAISNVYAKRPKIKILNFTPIGVVKTGAQKAAGRDYALKTAAFEAEMIDGHTGETLAALVALGLGDSLAKVKTGERKWSDIQEYLRGYAETLSNRF